MERAAELLRAGEDNVSVVAEKVGIRNVQYFCTKFKHAYGMSPATYRKMHRAAPDPLLPRAEERA